LNIIVSIALNALYFGLLEGKEVGYAFYINLACTSMLVFCLLKELTGFRYVLDRALLQRMLKYSWPILILGIAGIMNQTADKMLFPYIYEGSDMLEQLGIYGACAKVAMIMAMITQAFRFAYEPIVFAGVKDKDQHEMYAKAMKYFIIFTLLAYLMVIAWLDLLKVAIIQNSDYWSGLKVVPVVMAAELMMGIYFNLSFWYKVIDKTIWGAIFSGIGCAVLIAVNIIFVPRYGYMACAWGGFAGYGVAMVTSYVVGQKYYPIDYPLKDIALYIVIAAGLYALMQASASWPLIAQLSFNTLLVLLFMALIVKRDLPMDGIIEKIKKLKK
jgi:O-antigen/teichoic acid export membrane protein